MINSKVIRILKTLKSSEIPKLIDFVQSPYFNSKRQVYELCVELCKHYPLFQEERIHKENIHNKLFPKQTFDSKQMGYLQSDLVKLLVQFLSYENIKSTNQDLTRIRVFAERNLHQLYKREVDAMASKQIHQGPSGADQYKFNFELHDLKDLYFINTNTRKDDLNAHLASKNLDLYYICRKLQYFVVLLNRKQILGKEIEIPHLAFILRHAKENFLDTPIVKAYYEVILMQTKDKSLPHFYNLKETIHDYKSEFSNKEIAEIYEEAINYCIQRISYNQAFYIDEALKLYMEFLDSGSMYQKGFLSHWKFKNIIKLGLLLDRFEFVDQFINTYIEKIEPSYRSKALHYNYAELCFAMQNFDKALEYLSLVLQEDLELAYNLGSRMMLIKIFYQNNEEDALLSQIAAFTIFLKRSKNISNTKKKIYLNFCDILNKIMRQNPKHYLKIKKEIKDTKLLTDTNWLLKVYEELMPASVKAETSDIAK